MSPINNYYHPFIRNMVRQYLLMKKTNFSYFAKYKQNLTRNRNGSSSFDQEIRGQRVHIDKNSTQHIPSHSFVEQKSEEQKVYEEYKQIQTKYDRQLKQLQEQIQRIKTQTEIQTKKIHQAEASLETKKRELKVAKQKYQEMSKAASEEQVIELSDEKIKKLEQQITKLNQQNIRKMMEINEEDERVKKESEEVRKHLADLEQQYQKHLLFDYNEYQGHKKRLEQEEQSLKKQLEEIEGESQKIKRDIDKIQNMKPVSGQVHKKYLDLFQKMFISQEITKAERILSLKQEERKQTLAVNLRKEQLRGKQQEITRRQRKILERDQLIKKLTNQIREKSTLLLTKYHVDNQKPKK